MKQFLEKICAGQDLNEEEAGRAMAMVMEGQATPAQVAALLVALKMKGETALEIYGCARVMREKAEVIHSRRVNLTDTCGTGGDGRHTFNISTVAAIIAAGAGLPVAKHGNRSVSSKCGSADVLEALGVNLELTPLEMTRCVDEIGFVFLFAPLLHKAMSHAAAPRREVGIRSVFNLLGPLTNPAGVKRQVLGVYEAQLVPKLAQVLSLLGTEKALVVHGSDGSDELTLTGETLACEVSGKGIRSYNIVPEEAGLNRAAPAAVRGGGPAENALLAKDILNGKLGAYRDAALLNAAAALYVGQFAESLREGAILAQNSIDSGAALEKLAQLQHFSERRDKNALPNCG